LYALYRMVTLPVTLMDPNPVFKVMAQSFYRTLIGNYTQSIKWYHFQWPWVTSDPDFKVTTFFEVKYQKNGAS